MSSCRYHVRNRRPQCGRKYICGQRKIPAKSKFLAADHHVNASIFNFQLLHPVIAERWPELERIASRRPIAITSLGDISDR
jgi:hypothetical protein